MVSDKRTHCYISIRKTQEVEVKKAAFAALLTESENFRFIVVVDDDVDVFNEPDVMWAIGTRFRPEKDLLVVNNWCGPGGLIPSGWEYFRDEARTPIMASVVVIDATQPGAPSRYPPRAKPPEDTGGRLQLEDLLRPFDIAAIKS